MDAIIPPSGGLVNLWGARSLPALFGIVAIPVSYFGAYFAFKSRSIAQVTAAMMAVSPYGVYISQEAGIIVWEFCGLLFPYLA